MAIELTVGTGYIKTYAGILKIVELLASLIGVIIVAASGSSVRGVAFTVAAVGSIIASCIFIIAYFVQLPLKIPRGFIWTELHFALIWGIFYLIVSCLVIATLGSAYIAAGVFGLIATLTYFADGFHKYKLT